MMPRIGWLVIAIAACGGSREPVVARVAPPAVPVDAAVVPEPPAPPPEVARPLDLAIRFADTQPVWLAPHDVVKRLPPRDVQIDRHWVFAKRGGDLIRVPKSGGEPDVILADAGERAVFGQSADDLYVARANKLYRVPKRGGPAIALAPTIAAPRSIVVSADTIYIAHGDGDRTSILAVPTAGATSRVVTTFRAEHVVLAVDEHHVYWLADKQLARAAHGAAAIQDLGTHAAQALALGGNHVWLAGADGVHRIAKSGGVPQRITTTSAELLAVVDDELYAMRGIGDVVRVPLDGSAIRVLVEGDAVIFELAADRTGVYWTDAFGSIFRTSPHRGVEHVADLEASGSGPIAVVADAITFIDRSPQHVPESKEPDRVMRQPRAGGAPSVLHTAPTTTTRESELVADASGVYLLDRRANTVLAWAHDGTARTIARDLVMPHGLAVDATHVYWVEGRDQSRRRAKARIVRVAKAGAAIETLWSREHLPRVLSIAGDQLYWSEGHMYKAPSAGKREPTRLPSRDSPYWLAGVEGGLIYAGSAVWRSTTAGSETALWRSHPRTHDIREMKLAGNWVLLRLHSWEQGTGSLVKVPITGGAHEVVFEEFGDDQHFAGDGNMLVWSEFHAIYRMAL
jgi:hypothetical protein